MKHLIAIALAASAFVVATDLRVAPESSAQPPPAHAPPKTTKLMPELEGRHGPGSLLWVIDDPEQAGDFGNHILKRLAESKIPGRDEVKAAAFRYRMGHGGLRAEETERIVDLIRLARDVPEFGEKEDLVWIVRYTLVATGRGVTQELWLNSTNGKVLAVLPR